MLLVALLLLPLRAAGGERRQGRELLDLRAGCAGITCSDYNVRAPLQRSGIVSSQKDNAVSRRCGAEWETPTASAGGGMQGALRASE